jgi:hypothetical protein
MLIPEIRAMWFLAVVLARSAIALRSSWSLLWCSRDQRSRCAPRWSVNAVVLARSTIALRSSLFGQPCRCLCRGFWQITRTAPPRRMTLHFSHMGLTDARTFIREIYLP